MSRRRSLLLLLLCAAVAIGYNNTREPGDIVALNTVLGCVSTTGNVRAAPPHLHFAVYTASGSIDPLRLLADR